MDVLVEERYFEFSIENRPGKHFVKFFIILEYLNRLVFFSEGALHCCRFWVFRRSWSSAELLFYQQFFQTEIIAHQTTIRYTEYPDFNLFQELNLFICPLWFSLFTFDFADSAADFFGRENDYYRFLFGYCLVAAFKVFCKTKSY